MQILAFEKSTAFDLINYLHNLWYQSNAYQKVLTVSQLLLPAVNLFTLIKMPFISKVRVLGQRDRWEVKSTCCSCGGPQSGAQHLHGSSVCIQFPGCDAFFWPHAHDWKRHPSPWQSSLGRQWSTNVAKSSISSPLFLGVALVRTPPPGNPAKHWPLPCHAQDHLGALHSLNMSILDLV